MSVVGDYFELVRGTTYKSALLGRSGPALLGLATIQRNGGFRGDSLRTYGGESPEKLLVRTGELYVSLKDVTQSADLLGAVARVPSNVGIGRLTQDTVRLVPRHPGLPTAYLYWLLRTPHYRDYCRSRATGTTNLGLSRDDFLAYPVPPQDERRRAIVEQLERIEEKIELNDRMNATLDEMARALFKSWFVEFDPVRAKAEGRRPSHIDAATAALFPASFEDSPLGPIPTGWRVGEVGDVAESIRDSVKPAEVEPGTAYVGLDHIPRRSLAMTEWGDVESVTSGKVRFRNGDILFGRLRPYFAKVVVAPLDGVCSSDIVVCRPRQSSYLGIAATQLADTAFIDYCDAASTGTRMPRVSWEDMSLYPMALPADALIERFNTLVEPWFSLLRVNAHESRTLAGLRDALLPRLISGEIRVLEAARAVEVAV